VRALLYVVLPAALIIAASLFTWQGLQTPPEPAAVAAAETPRYAVTGALWVRLDREGNPEFRARAASVDYYADESAQLRTIALDALGGAESPWHLEAPEAQSPPHERRLKLKGGVRAGGNRIGGETVSFTSDTLWVDLLRKELRTDDAVRLETEYRSATARGLQADFEGQRVQLLKDVQVDYAPPG
jgi:LPS export ABC transporter protein LptC